jgi:hypothetical protein
MPRSEARIFTSIWRDPHFLGIDPSSQWLYMFLLSQDDLTYCGVMPLRERRWAAKAAGLLVSDIESSLKVLEASPRRFVVADHDTGELFVRSLIRRDGVWKQPNLMKLAREAADQVESPRIRSELLTELRRLPMEETGSVLVKTLVADFITDLEQGSPYPTAYPPDDPNEMGQDYPPDEGTANPNAEAAQGYGERNGEKVSVLPVPLSPVPPSLPAEDRKRGTRLPQNFAVTAEMVTWFRQECPHVDGKRETERFCDYWWSKPGKDGRKLDWVRTWKNWMRTAEDRAMPRGRASPSLPPTTDVRVGAGLDLADKYRAEENAVQQQELPA